MTTFLRSRRKALALAPAMLMPGALFMPAIARAQTPVKMRIGTHVSISTHMVMQKKPEILKNFGKSYDVEWVRFSGSGDAMPALVAGKLDGCLGTPFPMANALNQSKVPVTIVHQLLSFGADGYYDDATIVRTDSGISKVADLKGKVFGINAVGGTVEQGARIILKKNGLNPDRDVTFVEARPPFLATMVRDNKIQAATLFQPFYEEAIAKGDVKVLYRTADIYGGPSDYVFMAFEDKFLKANQKAVRDYIEDYLIAVNWSLDNRAEAVKMYSEQWKLPLPVVDSYLLTKKDYLVRRDGKVTAKAIQPVVDALASNGFIAPFDVAKYMDLSYLPK